MYNLDEKILFRDLTTFLKGYDQAIKIASRIFKYRGIVAIEKLEPKQRAQSQHLFDNLKSRFGISERV